MKNVILIGTLILASFSVWAAPKKATRKPAQKSDFWEIKETLKNQVIFKNPDIQPVLLQSGYNSDIEFTSKVVGVMKDGEDVPMLIYELTTFASPDPELKITRPVIDPKTPGKIEKWEFANTGISLADDPAPIEVQTLETDQPAEKNPPMTPKSKLRLLYGECLEPNHRVILSIRNKAIKFIEPEKFLGPKRGLSSNTSPDNLDPSFSEIQDRITKGKCKEMTR
jgi:hypothetical protein